MKNKLFLLILFFIVNLKAYAENILIEAEKISIDKVNEISIFEGNVVVTTSEKEKIEGNYAKYDKKIGFLIIKNNVVATDLQNNSNTFYCQTVLNSLMGPFLLIFSLD